MRTASVCQLSSLGRRFLQRHGHLRSTPSRGKRDGRTTFHSSTLLADSGKAAAAAAAPGGEADDFVSLLDRPPTIVKMGRPKRGFTFALLVLMPVTAFALGTWQIYRLDWKTRLIATYEDRLLRDPLPLPPRIDVAAIAEFDHRRVRVTGRLRHDQEMLLGPRIREGENGFFVVTPLERGGGDSTVLVNRGWIAKKFRDQATRPEGLPQNEITLQGILREPLQKGMFTPENSPEKGEFYFPDVQQMARLVGSQPVWIEETSAPNLLVSYDCEAKGIPIGRPAEVTLRNNHAQYIFTWYGLSIATSVMLWMVLRKPPSDITRRVRQSREW